MEGLNNKAFLLEDRVQSFIYCDKFLLKLVCGKLQILLIKLNKK